MCNNNQFYPQLNNGAAVERSYDSPMPQTIASTYTTTTSAYTAPVQQGLYQQQDANGMPITVNPNDPSSPLSVQPGGPGTPLVQGDNISMQSQLPETLTHYEYIPGFLRAHIGALMRVEFLVADNTTDRVGRLREVGASWILLESLDGSSSLMCDLYSIKFVTIMQQATPQFVAESVLQSENI